MEYIDAFLGLACAVILAYYIYKTFTQNFDYWTKQNVPCLKTRFFVGSVDLGNKLPLHELERELYNRYGEIYGRHDGQTPVLSVANPELLKRIFVKDFHMFPNRRDIRFNDPIMDNTLFALEGDDWRRVRNKVSPTLTSAKLKKMLPLLEDCSDVLVENLSKAVEQKNFIDCQRVFGAFTIDAIARCAFGMTINSLTSENHPFVTKAKMLFQCFLSWRTIMTIIFPKLMKWLRISLLNPETTQFYRDIVIQVSEQRKKNRGRDDFLQLLLDAETESNDPNNNVRSRCSDVTCSKLTSSEAIVEPKPSTKGLSHDEFLAQCITFFIAGYDATTSLLSYVVYNLAMNPEYQERAVQEIESVLAKYNGQLNYDSLSEMKFMDAILNECLRLCPSMVRSERRAEADCVLGDTNIALKKGMLISIPVYAIHRDPRWYPEPDSFKPERFYNPDYERPQYVHLPFGAGPRLCIGFRFVQMQVKMCLAKVLQRFRILPAPTTPANLEYIEMRNILKVANVEVQLEERALCTRLPGINEHSGA